MYDWTLFKNFGFEFINLHKLLSELLFQILCLCVWMFVDASDFGIQVIPVPGVTVAQCYS